MHSHLSQKKKHFQLSPNVNNVTVTGCD